MSAIQTWTLWQRMPPRYQLTSRFYDEDEDLSVSITPEKLPSARGSASPSRPTSGLNKQQQQQHHKQQSKSQTSSRRPPSGTVTPRNQTKVSCSLQDDSFMITTTRADDPKIDHQEQSNNNNGTSNSHNKFSFPNRKSEYVNNFQRQRRVNSARRRLAESPPPNGATPPSRLKSPRAQTAPVYPVTNPEVCSTQTIRFNDDRLKSSPTKKSLYKSETTKIDMFQFDEPVSPATGITGITGIAKYSEKQPKPKKYLIQDTKRSTMYIDNGKVICFGKSRHDLTQLLKTQSLRRDRNRGFFTELRRDYLTHPKYDINRNKEKRENDPRRVAYERIDYNKKVENILNYYSDEDGSSSPSPPPSRPSSTRYRVRSPTGGRMKGLSLTVNAPSRPPSRCESPVPENSDGFGDYIKLNRQSRLYDRKFYLRTPAFKHDGYTEQQLANCRCSMCRIELQLSIVTGANKATTVHETHVDNARNVNNTNTQNSIHHGQRTNNGKGNCDGLQIDAVDRKDKGDTSAQLKVTFQQPESVQEQHTLTISCTLPEMTELPMSEMASESGFESSRTGISVVPTESKTND